MVYEFSALSMTESPRCRYCLCFARMWSRTDSSSGSRVALHSWQGCSPLPWWLIALHNIFKPNTASLPPYRSRAWSQSLHQPGDSANSAIIGAFSLHLSLLVFLSASMTAFFISLKLHAILFKVKCVPKCSSSSLHSLTRQIESASSHNASYRNPCACTED